MLLFFRYVIIDPNKIIINYQPVMKYLLQILSVILIIPIVTNAQNLTRDTLNIKEVVVTGTKIEVSRKNIPMTISIISRENIEQSNETALLPIISEHVPGVFVTERGIMGFGVATGSAGGISIRGIGGSPNTQVLLLIDGHPQYMGIMGHPLPDAYVASDAERVEIIRGPASILYGSNAMGGAINIITKKHREDGLKAKGQIMLGSYNTRKYMGSLGLKKSKLNIYGSMNYNSTDGHRDSSDFRITNGYIKADYNLNNNLKLMTDFSLAKFNASDPGYIDANAGEKIDILRGKVSFSLENKYNMAEGAIKYFYNFGEHNITDGFHSIDHTSGLMIYQGLKLFKDNVITLGLDLKEFGGIAENILANNNEGVVFGDEIINENGIYVFVQQSLFGKLILNSGLRLEINSLYGKEFIPQAGFAWNPGLNTTVKGSVSKGFRSPTIRELYLWAPANEDLKPERMINYEIGLSSYMFSRKLNFEVTGFVANGDNMIKIAGQYPNIKYHNTGDFFHKGVEIAVAYRPVNKMKISANYSYLNMKEPVISSPEHQLYFSWNYEYKKFTFNLSLQHINNMYAKLEDSVSGTPANIQTYTILCSKIKYHISKNIQLFISGKNLTNEKYQINYKYPMPGVTVFAGLNLGF